MRIEAAVTTQSRLAHFSIATEFRTVRKQHSQFLPRSKQSGFQRPDRQAQNLGCFSHRSLFQVQADDGPKFPA
jgi:hypothetical protein